MYTHACTHMHVQADVCIHVHIYSHQHAPTLKHNIIIMYNPVYETLRTFAHIHICRFLIFF
jgi:hypothetical protein